MVDLDRLKAIADAGHRDDALVAMPVSLVREIHRDLRSGAVARRELARHVAFGDVLEAISSSGAAA